MDDDGELGSAIDAATAGTCIVLGAGSYGAVVLPGGVSLVGPCADEVKVKAVTVAAGEGSVLRGLEIGSGGLSLDGAQGVRVESVRVNGATAAAIKVQAGAEVTMVGSTVQNGALYGIFADDGASVTIEGSVILGQQGSGIATTCSGGCGACAARPSLSVTDSIIRNNHVGGVDLFTTDVVMNNVDIRGTLQGESFMTFKGGGGASIAACSTVIEARNLRIEDNFAYGILIDASTARLGDQDDAEDSVVIRGNSIGIWVQNGADGGVSELHNGRVENNKGVGLGIKGETQGFIFCRSKVVNTLEDNLPTDGASSEPVGHGIVWRNQASVKLEDATISGSSRVSVLIDGPMGTMGSMPSILKNVTLGGGDELKGIWQQNLPAGGMQPMVENAPAIQTDVGERFSVPSAPNLTMISP
ncbi:right-handed parallel beta-helix repeat-containing protein [Polyangium sp. 15x6]|uniref:right-handed parallel beta-helix repeat-containing protein n=1 Tax=Polyangium sp. 15x6 TaxID=3042687 RepID=UPI00249C39DE|nr:right-handed parallel beta-helix repeat-containing protein [Polyangium sp. 15x6]MDI3289016.1 right-handed parallel beta-helix repeat-containing protein [Polyangium sp. 15x6]